LVAPPAFDLTAKAWMASFFFVGTVTSTCCAGGFLGIWFITESTDSSIRDHIKTAVLIGVLASSILTIDYSVGNDRLILGAAIVTVLSAVVALISKTYSRNPSSTKIGS
jgi:hypothetical protein